MLPGRATGHGSETDTDKIAKSFPLHGEGYIPGPEGCSGDSPEEVFCPGTHPHLLVDLLVDPSPAVLQFAALGLGEGVAALLGKRDRLSPRHRGSSSHPTSIS